MGAVELLVGKGKFKVWAKYVIKRESSCLLANGGKQMLSDDDYGKK